MDRLKLPVTLKIFFLGLIVKSIALLDIVSPWCLCLVFHQ